MGTRIVGGVVASCRMDHPRDLPIARSGGQPGTDGVSTMSINRLDEHPVVWIAVDVPVDVGRGISVDHDHVDLSIIVKITEGGATTCPGLLIGDSTQWVDESHSASSLSREQYIHLCIRIIA